MTRFALVLAGGVGSRAWPASRPDRPKQCLPLVEGRSLLQCTVDRLSTTFPAEHILVVTGRDMARTVRQQLPWHSDRILVEPERRNTTAAIVWGAAEAARRGATSIAVLPSDHRIVDEAAFLAALNAALDAADADGPTLLGVRPSHPETGFGWIVPGPAVVVRAGAPVHRVERFVEKPDAERAAALLAAGALWNAGILCARLDDLGARLADALPGAASAWRALRDGAAVEHVWARIEPTSIDHGLLEQTAGLHVVPAAVGWSDLGTWTALAEVLPEHALGRARVEQGLAIDGGGHVVWAPGKRVVTLGVDDLVIVDTPDALLVCRRRDAHRVAEVAALIDPPQTTPDPPVRTARG